MPTTSALARLTVLDLRTVDVNNCVRFGLPKLMMLKLQSVKIFVPSLPQAIQLMLNPSGLPMLHEL